MINAELITQDICKQGYHIIDAFLAEPEHQALSNTIHTLYQQGQLNQARIGRASQTQQNNLIRNDAISWLEEGSPDPATQAYFKKTHELAYILNQSLYLGLSVFESHFAAYAPGSYYKKHIDQFASTQDRKISCVYYLNQHWEPQYGGELKLYNTHNELIYSLLPQGNRFICFNSELPHEVCLTHVPRFSIAGWMKTRPLNPII